MTPFETRQLGRTGVRVTTMGLGCATLGGRRWRVERAEAEAIVSAAWDSGIRYVDAAPFYGYGQSERAVGDALREKPRGEWVLSTKVGRLLSPRNQPGHDHPLPFVPVYDYSHDGILRSVEDSLQRLGLSRIDILYVHDIGPMEHGEPISAKHVDTLRGGGLRALQRLRADGTVAALGLGVNEVKILLDALDWGDWDAFLLAGRYTLLEQAPLDDLFPRCAASGTSIVVGGPFNSGILAGRDTWNYEAAPSEIVSRVRAIQAVCDGHRVPLAAAAVQFPLAHPQVASVIPGPRAVAELHEILRWFRTPIPAALWSDLRSAGLLRPDAPIPT